LVKEVAGSSVHRRHAPAPLVLLAGGTETRVVLLDLEFAIRVTGVFAELPKECKLDDAVSKLLHSYFQGPASRSSTAFAVALNCGMGSSCLKAEVNAFERLQIVLGRKSSYFGSR